MKQFRPSHPMGTRQYCLYRLRFVIARSIAEDFSRFGGDIAQFNNMAWIIQLMIVENTPIAMKYDNELYCRLARYASERAPSISYCDLLASIQTVISRSIQHRHSINLTSKGMGGPLIIKEKRNRRPDGGSTTGGDSSNTK